IAPRCFEGHACIEQWPYVGRASVVQLSGWAGASGFCDTCHRGCSNGIDARRNTRSQDNSIESNDGQGVQSPLNIQGSGRGRRGRARSRGDVNAPQAAHEWEN
uniref:Uncharacterized protein n=1 Tax=Cannabis sativa TaxID=3483 RepID=A0A803P419_CANSA